MQAIVYTSNTGTTKKYADLLAKRTGLPAYSLKEAGTALKKGAEVIYLGWLMASEIKGCKKAKKLYDVKAACGVGMGASGTQLKEVRARNKLAESMPVFTLQGGFDISKLHGIYKFMMTVMVKTAGKGLSSKQDRTPDEDDMLDMMLNGGDRVSEDKLQPVLDWLNA